MTGREKIKLLNQGMAKLGRQGRDYIDALTAKLLDAQDERLKILPKEADKKPEKDNTQNMTGPHL
jgi:hypothetical protein